MKTFQRLSFLFISVAIVATSYNANAQMQPDAKKSYTGTSITLKGGIAKPFTDIRTRDFGFAKAGGVSEMKPGFGLSINHMFSSVLGIQGNFTYSQLLGLSDFRTFDQYKGKYFEDANLWSKLGFSEPVYFKTNVINGSADLYINLSNFAMSLRKANQKPNNNRRFGVYAAFGIGLVSFDSKINGIYTTQPAGKWDTASLGVFKHYSTYSDPADKSGQNGGRYLRGFSDKTVELEFPVSLGVKYKISRSFDIGLENTMHYVNTDKLDAYVSNLKSPKRNIDKYDVMALTLTYKFIGSDPNKDYVEWMDPTEAMYDEYQMLADKIKKMTTDSDNDGVADIFDKEPNTPAGNKVDGSGVSLDVDGDGVPDAKDSDLFTPKGASVDADGKPVDTDGDGVPDVNDKEPGTKPGALVNYQGKTIRQDFADANSSNGAYTPPTIFFDSNSSDIKVMYYPEIAELAKYLKTNAAAKVKLTGNADERGSDNFNQKLGQKRADAVKNYLVKYYGVDASRIETTTTGEKSPLYKSMYSLNRRVEIEIKK